MNNNSINSFTFFSNYYDLIKNLPEEDGNKLMRAIVEYMFDDIEPEFDGLLKAIFENIKLGLKVSKRNSRNGSVKKPQPMMKFTDGENEYATPVVSQIQAKLNPNQIEIKSKQNPEKIETPLVDMSMSMSNSLSKSSLGKGGVGGKPFLVKQGSPGMTEVKQVVEKWNLVGLAQVRLPLAESRANKVKLRIKEQGLETVLEAIDKIPQSKFLMGDNKQGWRCSFDWLFTNDHNILKVLEGNYNDHDVGTNKTSNPFIKSILSKGVKPL